MEDTNAGDARPSLSLAKKFTKFLVLLLRLKLLGFLFAVVPVLALLSNLMLLATKPLPKHKWNGEPEFFSVADLIRSRRLLVDKSAHSAQELRLTDMTSSSGSSSWLASCKSDADCSKALIGELDARVLGYMQFASSPAQLQCFEQRQPSDAGWSSDSDVACAMAHQLMARSLSASTAAHFDTVDLFQARMLSSQSSLDGDDAVVKGLSESVCRSWMKTGSFDEVFSEVVLKNMLLSMLAVALYFLVTTGTCIHALKRRGFLKQLFRNGMSVSIYWAVVWSVTMAECSIFSGILVLSHVLHCPGLFPAAQAAQVFCMALFTFLTLAGVGLLLLTLLQTLAGFITAYTTAVIILVFRAFQAEARVASVCITSPYLTPAAALAFYARGALTSEFMRRSGGPDVTATHPTFFKVILPLNGSCWFLLVLVTIYLDFILENGNGFLLPLGFPFKSSFWSPSYGLADRYQTRDEPQPSVEPVASSLALSVQANNLWLHFQRCSCLATFLGYMPGQVLKGLSCNIHSGQITAIIGHSGAGKSILLRVLTGQVAPTAGSAVICGVQVTDPVRRLALRGRLGVSEQSSVLCDSLTVMQSVKVTLLSRGSCMAVEGGLVRNLMRRLGLEGMGGALTSQLSSSQQRMLCTILALLGSPAVLLLDEPTSGLDPLSRRQVWKVLQEQKAAGRTIVLCTQFMDETDILADRKIILAEGAQLCAGSSQFLKRSFGCAFSLAVSLKSADAAPGLLARVQGARVKSLVQKELQLRVPVTEPDVLINTIRALEASPDAVEAFRLTQPNLDDIFMKVHGASASFVTEAFRRGNVSAFATTEESFSKALAAISLGQPAQRSSRSPCLMRQACLLLLMNFRRQMGTASRCVSRFITVLSILSLLFIVLYLDPEVSTEAARIRKKAKSNFSELSLAEAEFLLVNTSTVRLWDTSGLMGLRRVCIGDDVKGSSLADACAKLVGTGDQQEVLSKPAADSLRTFLSSLATREKLQKFCPSICAIIYMDSWSAGSARRNVTIGVLVTSRQFSNLAYVYTRVFTSLARLFNSTGPEVTAQLSMLLPLSGFGPPQLMLQLLLLATCLVSFVSSAVRDPLLDMDWGIRAHLVTMATSRVAYWLAMYAAHLCQFALCGAVAVSIAALLTVNFRGAFVLCAVMLPAVLLGCSAHLLTAYALAAVVRRSITLVLLLYQVYVLAVALALVQLHCIGRVAALVGIWLLPHAAPTGFIIFAVKLAIHSKLYHEAASWDKVQGLLAASWDSQLVQHSLLAMAVHIPLCIGIIAIADNWMELRGLVYCCCEEYLDDLDDTGDTAAKMDPGVAKETERVDEFVDSDDNVLELAGLCKTHGFGPRGVRAVRGVTFGAKAGEVLGLVGPSGAGKTTAMRVIAGQQLPSDGVCEVQSCAGDWLADGSGASSGEVGYCPQDSPLLPGVSVERHLRLFAELRGVRQELLEARVGQVVRALGLQEQLLMTPGQLPGGGRRRLCLALALLGDPALLAIDEASSGLDPSNQRFLWRAVRCKLQLQGHRAVVLTTHCMEEAEALCNRLGILHRGRLVAFGSVQQLRSLYGSDLILDVTLQARPQEDFSSAKSRVHDALLARFPGTRVSDDLAPRFVQFQVPRASVQRLSEALLWLQKHQAKQGMQQFSLYQMTLGQIFVSVIRQNNAQSLGQATSLQPQPQQTTTVKV